MALSQDVSIINIDTALLLLLLQLVHINASVCHQLPCCHISNCTVNCSRTSPNEYTVSEPSSMGNIGRPELSSGTGVIRRRGCADGRDFLDVLAIADDVTSSAASGKKP